MDINEYFESKAKELELIILNMIESYSGRDKSIIIKREFKSDESREANVIKYNKISKNINAYVLNIDIIPEIRVVSTEGILKSKDKELVSDYVYNCLEEYGEVYGYKLPKDIELFLIILCDLKGCEYFKPNKIRIGYMTYIKYFMDILRYIHKDQVIEYLTSNNHTGFTDSEKYIGIQFNALDFVEANKIHKFYKESNLDLDFRSKEFKELYELNRGM